MPRLYSRDVMLLVVAVVSIPLFLLVVFSGPRGHSQDTDSGTTIDRVKLETQVRDLKDHIQYLESIQLKKRLEEKLLEGRVARLLQNVSLANNRTGKTLELFYNLSAISSGDIVPPNIFDYLPYLRDRGQVAVIPAFKMSNGRTDVSMVLGISSVKREKKSYLFETLKSLTDNLSVDEMKDCLIILSIAEPQDQSYVHSKAVEINKHFRKYIDSGLLEIISPSSKFYPDFKSLKPSLGDSQARTVWRTKQNLDFCYLMMYARTRGRYYVQLEDDVITKPGYMTTMKSFAVNQRNPDWFMLQFSLLGFIGKLFKSTDLSYVIQFLAMFHRFKPCDWLIEHLLQTRVCSFDKDLKHCRRSISEISIRYKPSLFQHIGTHSSLKGKIQKLKDKDYGKVQLHHPHSNPKADVNTSLQVYQRYTLDKAYRGDSIFWATLPKSGDTATFTLRPPISIESVYFRCGTLQHEDDQFYNTTVEVKPFNAMSPEFQHSQASNRTIDNFYIVSQFRDGEASAKIHSSFGVIQTVRLRVLNPSDKWIILSEILLKPTETKSPK